MPKKLCCPTLDTSPQQRVGTAVEHLVEVLDDGHDESNVARPSLACDVPVVVADVAVGALEPRDRRRRSRRTPRRSSRRAPSTQRYDARAARDLLLERVDQLDAELVGELTQLSVATVDVLATVLSGLGVVEEVARSTSTARRGVPARRRARRARRPGAEADRWHESPARPAPITTIFGPLGVTGRSCVLTRSSAVSAPAAPTRCRARRAPGDDSLSCGGSSDVDRVRQPSGLPRDVRMRLAFAMPRRAPRPVGRVAGAVPGSAYAAASRRISLTVDIPRSGITTLFLDAGAPVRVVEVLTSCHPRACQPESTNLVSTDLVPIDPVTTGLVTTGTGRDQTSGRLRPAGAPATPPTRCSPSRRGRGCAVQPRSSRIWSADATNRAGSPARRATRSWVKAVAGGGPHGVHDLDHRDALAASDVVDLGAPAPARGA